MQRFFWPVLLVLIAWCASLTYVLLNDPRQELSDELQSGQSAIVAYVQGDSLQKRSVFILEQEQALFAAIQQVQIALDSRAAPLRTEAQELIDYANGGSATNEELQMAQQRLMEIENIVGQMQSMSQDELVTLEGTIQDEIASRLAMDVADFAAERGIDIVLNWGLSGEGVLYGKADYDITEALLIFMNERHALQAKSE